MNIPKEDVTKKLGAVGLIVFVLTIVVVLVSLHAETVRLEQEIERLIVELAEAKDELKRATERNGHLKRELKDAYHAARSQGAEGQPSVLLANAFAESYHSAVRSMQSRAEGAGNFAQLVVKYDTGKLPKEEKEALLSSIGSDNNPSKLVAVASFQDADVAVKTLSEAVEIDPLNISAWAALARKALVAPGAGSVFSNAIDELIARDPNNAYPYQLAAVNACKAKDLWSAYDAVSAAAMCDRSDDYRIEEVAYREAVLSDYGYSQGLARHLATQGVWSDKLETLGDQKNVASSLAAFAEDMQKEGNIDLAAAAYDSLAQYTSQLVGQSWTITGEMAALSARQEALRGLLATQNSSGRDLQGAYTRQALGEAEDRLKWIKLIVGRLAESSDLYAETIMQSDADLASYYDSVLRYGEAKATEMVLRKLEAGASE